MGSNQPHNIERWKTLSKDRNQIYLQRQQLKNGLEIMEL